MRPSWRWGLAVAGVAAVACGDSPSSGPLELDVVTSEVGDSVLVTVQLRERDRWCECSRVEFPRRDHCDDYSDVVGHSCEVAPARCLTSLHLEHDRGITALIRDPGCPGVASANLDSTTTSYAELVFEGCGDDVRVTLPLAGGPAPPTIAGFDYTEEQTMVHHSSPGASAVLVGCGTGFAGVSCLRDNHSPAAMPLYYTYGDLDLTALVALATPDAGAHTVRLWQASPTVHADWVYFPRQNQAGNFALDNRLDATIDLTIDGVTEHDELRILDAAADLLAEDVDAHIGLIAQPALAWEAELAYRAGPSRDLLRYRARASSSYFAGEIDHVEPDDGLVTGLNRDELYQITIAPVTLDEETGDRTLELGFTLRWNLGLIARPLTE